MKIILALTTLTLLVMGAGAQCNAEDHHPENGGYFIVGAAGESDVENLDSAHSQKLPNTTWAPGVYYPHGENVICDSNDRGCSPPCNMTPGCPQFLDSHTCSILRFCPPAETDPAPVIYQLPGFDAIRDCDFTNAIAIETSRRQRRLQDGLEDRANCVDYVFEEDHQLTEYYFASLEGCASGQKLAVKIEDFSITASQCAEIGLTTPRIRNCDCRLQKTPSVLSEPCRTAFSDSCQDVVIEGECCDSGTCLSVYEDFNHPRGQAKELERRETCDNAVPGLCYNEDGMGTDTNRAGSVDCCSHTCTECGTELSPFAEWKPCEAVDGTTASCGFLSRYDSTPYMCDFSLCADSDHWSVNGEAFEAFAEGPPAESSAVFSRVVGATFVAAFAMIVQFL